MISIAEFDDVVVVGGVGKTEGYEQSQIKPFHLLLMAEDVEFMLNEAFCRRAPAPSQNNQQSGLRRSFRSS